MNTTQRSPQNRFLFGERLRNWLVLDPTEWQDLKLPDHLSDQIYRISLAKTPTLHLFEFWVSPQCPKEAYARIATCIGELKLDRFVISMVHGRNAGTHLIFWRRSTPSLYHHLDLDPASLSRFDEEVLEALRKPAPLRVGRLFELLEGQKLDQSFVNLLRQHLQVIKCPNEEAYHGLVDFVLKLVFLIFVQRKGWLDSDPAYLENKMVLCELKNLHIPTFFFKPLFALLEGHQVASPLRLGQLPHLGGGLFEFHPDQLPRLSNEWCLNLYRTLVSRYSFSLFEAHAGRKVIGICPEVLGHVFENLIQGEDRRSQGIFYTPLEVAERKVEAALQAWRRHQNLDDAAWEAALPNLRILDPSCGSGTYLVAAFTVLLRHRLDFAPKNERYNGKLYALKRAIVLENLYGVDIHPMAVKLAEVRLWLNMIQDLEVSEPQSAPALPNLQHHLRPGDFLGRYLPTARAKIPEWPRYEMLEKLRTRFPLARPASRASLLRHIYRLEKELLAWLGQIELEQRLEPLKQALAQPTLPGQEAFADERVLARGSLPSSLLHIAFSRVFLEGGFQLIVGNPPWLRCAGILESQRQAILEGLDAPKGLRLKGQVDLSLYFVVACLKILQPGGHLSFLLPGKFLQARYGAGLRAWLIEHASIDYLFDYGQDHRFLFQADTFPLALGLTLCPPEPDHTVTTLQINKQGATESVIPQAELADGRGIWLIENGSNLARMRQWPRLGDFDLTVRRGVVTGAKSSLTFTTFPKGPNAERIRPLLRGRDIQADKVRPGGWIYWPFTLGAEWYQDLPRMERDWLEGTGQLQRGSNATPAKTRLKYRPRSFGPWVLIWKYLAATWQVALLKAGNWVPDQTTYFINFKDFATAYRFYSWFHSPEAFAWLQAVAERGKDRCFFYYAHTVETLPIPPDLQQRPLFIPAEQELLPQEGGGRWASA